MSGSPVRATASPSQTGGATAAPKHVGIIMDGNGRWAQRRGLPRIAGHREGVQAAQEIVRAAGELGIEVLTLYAFSSENWQRPAAEISDLMNLLRRFIRSELDELADAGIRIRVIGDYQAFEPDVVELIDSAVARTEANSRGMLVIALNYGSHAEIAAAARAFAEQVAAGERRPADLGPELFESYLSTAGLPPLDLLIRTSGEKRLSNFLLWQAAYAELVFSDLLWPDFDRRALVDCLEEYGRRERRYGG
ncbi:MAG: isoprenyl transferase, partial [Sphingomonadales bacterium]|nr:isoprenyl transferase [Sphingomonadales bacterium]